MNKMLALPALVVTLAACAPTATTAPVAPARVYTASQDAVYDVVLAVISADPGVPAYNRPFNIAGENMRRIPTGPWEVTTSDRAGGFLRAQAQSSLVNTFGGDSGQRETHTLSATINGSGQTTRVLITTSERATYLRDAIFEKLDTTFQRAP